MIYTAGILSDFEDVILENMSNFFSPQVSVRTAFSHFVQGLAS